MTDDGSAEEDLRATIDSVSEDALALAAVEEEKRRLDPADPRMTVLSDTAKELASRAAQGTITEGEVARELQRDRPPRRPD